ncbi:hypothetical protein JW948_12135 [bacterium]|nr:hypothetical protein [bacterium]
MHFFKKNKIVVPLLILISLLVWSRNLWLLLDNPENEEGPNGSEIENLLLADDIDADQTSVTEKYVYSSGYRDPFKPWFEEADERISKQRQQQAAPSVAVSRPNPPYLRYCGLIGNAKEPMAIMEDHAGEIYFVCRGDTVLHVCITRILEDSVFCRFDTLDYKLPMHR